MTPREAAQLIGAMADSLADADSGTLVMQFSRAYAAVPDLNAPERARETYRATVDALRDLAQAVAAENGGRGVRDAWDHLRSPDIGTPLILNTTRTAIELAGLGAALR
jgi:hypothetical protein